MKNKNIKKNKFLQAFTLIELLVYIAIASIVLTIILEFTINIVESTARTGATQEVFHNTRLSLTKMRYDIQTASGYNAGTTVFNDNNGVLVLNVGTDTVRYSLSGGVLMRQLNATPAESITTSKVRVTRLLFVERTQTGGRKSINIEMDIEMINPSNRPELRVDQTIKTNVILRNS